VPAELKRAFQKRPAAISPTDAPETFWVSTAPQPTSPPMRRPPLAAYGAVSQGGVGPAFLDDVRGSVTHIVRVP